jgi:hypothetical protein
VPDAKVTILGHTDAIGGDAYNIDLSKRRALAVTQELVRRGVRPEQLSMVAIGKNQPIAPNTTDEGRALNRRVEFMISASQEANRALVQQHRINRAYLPTTAHEPPPPVAANKVVVSVFNFTTNLNITINRVNSTDGAQSRPDQSPGRPTKQPNVDSQGAKPQEPPNQVGNTTPPEQPGIILRDSGEIRLQQPEDMAFNLKEPDAVNVKPLDEEFKPFELPPGS